MENVQLTNDIGYAFKVGTLEICIMMYFLNCFPLNDNVVWKKSVPVYKKILEHYNSFENGERVYEKFFRKMLEKFGVNDIPLPVRIAEVGSSSGKVEKK